MAEPFRLLKSPPLKGEQWPNWFRELWEIVNSLRDGKANNVSEVTLTANTTTTTVTDYRVAPGSWIGLMPLTANAALEQTGHLHLDTPGCYVSALTKNQFTVTHSNDAAVDRTFRYVVIG